MANWTDNMIQNVWEKGKIISGYNKYKYRKDQCDEWIKRIEYGNRSSSLGWEIDHLSPGIE